MNRLQRAFLCLFLVPCLAHGLGRDIVGPTGSWKFGGAVHWLPNGNLVVVDSEFSPAGGPPSIGAVYLYSAKGVLINQLTGSSAHDRVGSDGVQNLSNGNFVVRSRHWNSESAMSAGAITWCDAVAGCTGVVSAANSLVGTTTNDRVGEWSVVQVSDSSYLIRSPLWDNGTVENAGAITWAQSTTGLSGEITESNSLVGSSPDDQVGFARPQVLPNGNVVINVVSWDSPAAANVGAVVMSPADAPITGLISASMALVGTQAGDSVGVDVTVLANGNFVVSSPYWSNAVKSAAGAATWVDGNLGLTGAVSSTNSLVGSTGGDYVASYFGEPAVFALANGNYVVRSPRWSSETVGAAGAVTWCSGTTGVQGAVSALNSLVGSSFRDHVGASIRTLPNGNYVVGSPEWDCGAVDCGALTWGNGTSGVAGPVSDVNSLTGASLRDRVGALPIALSNGNFIACTPDWDRGEVVDAGAATWGDGDTGVAGQISAANSLVGAEPGDRVGTVCTALSNGNYVVRSPAWVRPASDVRGALTWIDGSVGRIGELLAKDSLVGNSISGIGYPFPLADGNYLVMSPGWGTAEAPGVGAVTWVDGTVGMRGSISADNSLVGTLSGDGIGSSGAVALADGGYLVSSELWRDPSLGVSGALTWGRAGMPQRGRVSASNSIVGLSQIGTLSLFVTGFPDSSFAFSTAIEPDNTLVAMLPGSGRFPIRGTIKLENSVINHVPVGNAQMLVAYDEPNRRFAIGRPGANLVTIVEMADLPSDSFDDGFE